uniref:POM121-like protein 2 n=1 Tax=Nannospalax galili TaxID=1026970 RepID=A0A8C6RAU8_NANGA
MGSYLGTPGSSASPAPGPADGRERPAPRRPLCQVHRVQRVRRAQPARRHRPAPRPPSWDPANPTALVSEAWRRFPMPRPQNAIMGSLPSDWWESYLKRNIWSLRHPRATWSPVTVKISPPEQKACPGLFTDRAVNPAGPLEDPPGQCAKDPVLMALQEHRRVTARWEEPLFRHSSNRRRSPASPPSSFKPPVKGGATVAFVARPGPLKRTLHSRTSDPKSKRSHCSVLASICSRGPFSTQRNAISSTYSSSGDVTQSWKFSKASVQMPEWPLKKAGKSPHSHPLDAPSNSGHPSQQIPPLQSGPEDLLTGPGQRDCTVTEEDLTSQTQARQSNQTKEDPPGTSTGPKPETGTAFQFLSSLNPISSGTASSTVMNPQLEKLRNKWASPGCWKSDPVQGISSDSKPTAAFIQLSPSSPILPDTGPAWPPSIPQPHRSEKVSVWMMDLISEAKKDVWSGDMSLL